MSKKRKKAPVAVARAVLLRVKPANSWLNSLSWFLGDLERRYKECAEQEAQWLDVPITLVQLIWNKPTMEERSSLEMVVEVNAALVERFVKATSDLRCTQIHPLSEVDVLDLQASNGIQEVVAYDFGRGRLACHCCVYVDMGLLEYTTHRAELLKRAIWDSDERVSRLVCTQCHHPLIAIAFGKRQPLPYKDSAAFVQRWGICYILPPTPTRNARRYRYKDFLQLTQGDVRQAAMLFERCEREDPHDLVGWLALEEGCDQESSWDR